MADVSRRLRDARERANLSIQDISARTKIGISVLEALESGNFERLPGDFYARAFLRTYARELRLPADELVREYAELRDAAVPPATPTAVVHHAAQLRERRAIDALETRYPWQTLHWRNWTGLAAVLVATGLLVTLTAYRRPPPDARARPDAVGTGGAAATAPAPAPTTGQTRPPIEKLVIEIRPTARIWVAATADGNSAIYRLLKPGEVVVVEAQKELSFRVGDAGAFVYTLNGVPGKPVGSSGEVREFEITRENYRNYAK
jgi:transcriptional regulator with XRE-family HTH domain